MSGCLAISYQPVPRPTLTSSLEISENLARKNWNELIVTARLRKETTRKRKQNRLKGAKVARETEREREKDM